MSKATRPRLRRFLGLATGSRLARGYLALVAASAGAMFVFPDSFLAMAPMLLTAPLSFLGVAVPFGPGTEGGGAVEVLAVASWLLSLLVCALVNAAALGALVERSGSVTRGERAPRSLSAPRTLRSLLAPAMDNWPARAYVAVVAASLGFFLWACYLSPDPGFAGVWPLMAAAPLSFLALLPAAPVEYAGPDWLSPLVFATGVAVAGLVNAALLGRLTHRLRVRDPRPAA